MKRRRVHLFAWATLVATILLVAFGGFTRGSGSGYGCADQWPLCQDGLLGGLLPRAEFHMVVEWTHRWIAATVGVLAVVTLILAIRAKLDRRWVILPAGAAIVVIGIQAWLGRQVVKGDLDADLVSLHLAVSMIIVGLLVELVVATRGGAATAPPVASWTARLAVAAVGSYGLLLLGSFVHDFWVSGWPLVHNTWNPNLSSSYVLIHFIHRVVAGLGMVYLGYLVVAGRRLGRPDGEQQWLWLAGAAYLVNVGLGAVHVFTEVTSSLVVALHLGLAAVVWAALAGVTLLALPVPGPNQDTT